MVLSALLVAAYIAKAEDNEKTVNAKTDEVTVFIRGAQLYTKGNIQVPKGVTVFVFDELANSLNAQSMQA